MRPAAGSRSLRQGGVWLSERHDRTWGVTGPGLLVVGQKNVAGSRSETPFQVSIQGGFAAAWDGPVKADKVLHWLHTEVESHELCTQGSVVDATGGC